MTVTVSEGAGTRVFLAYFPRFSGERYRYNVIIFWVNAYRTFDLGAVLFSFKLCKCHAPGKHVLLTKKCNGKRRSMKVLKGNVLKGMVFSTLNNRVLLLLVSVRTTSGNYEILV